MGITADEALLRLPSVKTVDELTALIGSIDMEPGGQTLLYSGRLDVPSDSAEPRLKSSDVAARLSSLNTGCAPAPHFIVAMAPTYDSTRDEALAHSFFSTARREGEFFQVTAEEVKAFFANHIMTQYQLELAEHIAKTQGDA